MNDRAFMSEQPLQIGSFDGTAIPAILTLPDKRAHEGRLVVLLHGITTSKDEYQDAFKTLAQELAERGAASLRIDFRGHGDSSAASTSFAIGAQTLDILRSATWAQTEGIAMRLVVLAASFAAPAAICASYILEETVERLVLLAPAVDLQATFVEPETEWGRNAFGSDRIRSAALQGGFRLDGLELSRQFAVDLLLTDPQPLLKRLTCPISLLHGEDDGMVPFSASKRCAERVPSIRFFPMPHTGHGLAEVGDDTRASTQTRANIDLLLDQLTG